MTAPENYTFNPQNLGNFPPGVSEWAALQVPIRHQAMVDPALADIDAIKLAIASQTTVVTYSGAQLDGVIGAGALSPPRNITVTTAGVTPADAPATATITGTSVDGGIQTEALTVSQIAATVAGVKMFASVTSIALTAGDGTAATLAFGFGAILGLDSALRDIQGVPAAAVLKEVEAGVVVTTGTFASATTSPPFGSYTPATPPDGANDYALVYMTD